MDCYTPYPTIPTVYDPDLSNEEKIILLMVLVQNLSDTVDSYESVTPEWLASYVAFQIMPIQEALTALSNETDSSFMQSELTIGQMVETVKQYTDEVMTAAYEKCIEYVGEMTTAIIERLDSIVVEDVLLRNAVTGEMNTQQVIINDLASLHQNALTAGAFDALLLTASAFDALNVNAFEYDFEGLTP